MIWLLWLWLLLSIPLFPQQVDQQARERITRLEEQMKNNKEVLDDIRFHQEQISDKLDMILQTGGSTGNLSLAEQVVLNTKFRQEIEKFIWLFVGALVGQLALFIGALFKIKKVLNLIK